MLDYLSLMMQFALLDWYLKINNQAIENLGFNKEVKLDDGATFGLIGLAETRAHYYFNPEESVKIEYYIGKWLTHTQINFLERKSATPR